MGRSLYPMILVAALAGCSKAVPPASAPPPDTGKAVPAPPPQPAQAEPTGRAPASAATPPPPHVVDRHARIARVIAPDEYRAGDELAAWKQSLLTGKAEYRVPGTMTAQQASTVTVVVHGFADKKTVALPDANGSGDVKVSSNMKVELLAPLNPDEFTIKTQGNPAIQFIPNDGYQTWMWNVTPHLGAKAQRLQIRLSLVHKSADGTVEQIIEDKTYDVDVEVKSSVKLLEEEYQQNRMVWWKTIWAKLAALIASLGGVSGLVAWWQKRKKPG